jgi:hypothetical protein
MGTPDKSPAGWDSADIPDARAEALAIVADACQWQLAGERWHSVEQVLIEMEAALAAGDRRGLATATADLELAGQLRITKIGDAPVVPPTPPVRYQLDRLVHSLGGTPPASQHHDDPERP